MTAPKLPFGPREFIALDRDPETSASEIMDYAPKTTDALIRLYVELANQFGTYPPGRHIESVETKGDRL